MSRAALLLACCLLAPACAPSDEEACAHSVQLFEANGGTRPHVDDPDKDHKPPSTPTEARDAATASCLMGVRTFRARNGDAASRTHRACLVHASTWKDVLDCELVR